MDLLVFWERSRRGRDLPSRSDFAPEDLLAHLGWLILLDVQASPRRFRFRLIGTFVTTILARDSTGRYLDDLYAPSIYDDAVRPYQYVVEHRRPVRSIGRMVHAEKGDIPYEAVYLPYSSGGGHVDLVMERALYERVD